MIKALQPHTKDIYIAGDDDQAIFGWAGADVDSFINFDAVEIPLKQSKRVPRAIHTRALQRLDNIKLGRLDKPWNTPTAEEGNIKSFFFQISTSFISDQTSLSHGYQQGESLCDL